MPKTPNLMSATVVNFVAGILTVVIVRSLKLFKFDQKTIQLNNKRMNEGKVSN